MKSKNKKFIIYSEELEHGEVEIKAKDLEEAREKALELIDIHEIDELGEIVDWIEKYEMPEMWVRRNRVWILKWQMGMWLL